MVVVVVAVSVVYVQQIAPHCTSCMLEAEEVKAQTRRCELHRVPIVGSRFYCQLGCRRTSL